MVWSFPFAVFYIRKADLQRPASVLTLEHGNIVVSPSSIQSCYVAPHGLLDVVTKSLMGTWQVVADRLVLSDAPVQENPWALNTWRNPQIVGFNSIKDAADILRGVQRNWVHYPIRAHRRAQLITEKLPFMAQKPLSFPYQLPTSPLGSWALLDEHTLLYASDCTSPLPHGEYNFIEDKTEPPTRAYLKLYEAFTRLGVAPRPGEICLDLGACPGGWTWVMAKLGAKVFAYDRSELASQVMAMPQVNFRTGDAFKVLPQDFDRVDWLCSDVICYPDKLLEFVQQWVASGKCRNFVCTLKFQGTQHYGIEQEFLKIPGSRVVHLWHNKHELTWMNLASDRL